VTVPASYQGKRVFLRFEAVDWAAMVWVNGRPVGQHEGGYTPFEFDVTNVVEAGKVATVAVRALDGTNANR
jgi:beta-galactosidase/beta-glucuronidase